MQYNKQKMGPSLKSIQAGKGPTAIAGGKAPLAISGGGKQQQDDGTSAFDLFSTPHQHGGGAAVTK